MARGLLLVLGFFLTGLRPEAQVPSGEAVNAAIDRGVEFLLRSQNRDGSWGLDLHRWKAWDEQRDGPTALALYALLKCGTRPDHPAVQRAVAFLGEGDPRHTYSLGVELMALEAVADPALHERIQTLADRLLADRDRWGWDYGKRGLGMNRPDLSNTQVAVLGLRAARLAGADLPPSIWSDLVKIATHYKTAAEPVPGELRGKYRRQQATFGYVPDGKVQSASMVTAGLTVLGVAFEADPRLRARYAEVADQGLAWLENHFSVESNTGGSDHWLGYYLYGLERVGALHAIDRLGEHDWYGEGAAVILRMQLADGSWRLPGQRVWPPAPLETSSACFALLFLRRATLSHSSALPVGFRMLEGEGSDVWIRVDPGRRWTLWVSGFSRATRARLKDEAGEPRFTVERVTWVVDGNEVAVVEGEPEEVWTSQRFAARWESPDGKAHTVECRVRARPVGPEGLSDPASPAIELRSKPLSAISDAVLEPWTLAYATDDSRNLLRSGRVAIEASSEVHAFGGRELVLDGMQGSVWSPDASDVAPWIRVLPSKAVRARQIWISPAPTNRDDSGRYDSMSVVELVLNGDEPIRLELEADPERKTRYELPRAMPLRSIEVRLVDVVGKLVGLAEIEVQ